MLFSRAEGAGRGGYYIGSNHYCKTPKLEPAILFLDCLHYLNSVGCAEWSERTAAGGAAVVGYLAVVAAGQRFALASQVDQSCPDQAFSSLLVSIGF